jgi:hypothetical protein
MVAKRDIVNEVFNIKQEEEYNQIKELKDEISGAKSPDKTVSHTFQWKP